MRKYASNWIGVSHDYWRWDHLALNQNWRKCRWRRSLCKNGAKDDILLKDEISEQARLLMERDGIGHWWELVKKESVGERARTRLKLTPESPECVRIVTSTWLSWSFNSKTEEVEKFVLYVPDFVRRMRMHNSVVPVGIGHWRPECAKVWPHETSWWIPEESSRAQTRGHETERIFRLLQGGIIFRGWRRTVCDGKRPSSLSSWSSPVVGGLL